LISASSAGSCFFDRLDEQQLFPRVLDFPLPTVNGLHRPQNYRGAGGEALADDGRGDAATSMRFPQVTSTIRAVLEGGIFFSLHELGSWWKQREQAGLNFFRDTISRRFKATYTTQQKPSQTPAWR